MQINIMNSRAAQLVAQGKERWPLAGDQLYVDLDLVAKKIFRPVRSCRSVPRS